ncbi:MAG: ribosome-associated translation inhibitor RaiA [Dehalococcoidia bacterium]|nr:MAG: ribosome-associated translation inhibitor RaiA [Dehalococcoidia bacterium]
MELTFRSRRVTVTDSLREYTNRKLSRLSRYLPPVDEAVVELKQEGGENARRYVVQLTVNCDGTYLRAEERGSRLLPAIDAAADILSHQARRYKEKVYHRDKHVKARQAALAGKAAEPAEVEEEEEREEEETEIVLGRVVRIKRFPVKPMSEEEAIEQMELLHHDFFLFFDADANTYALLYRRREGDYGMIIPEAL